MPDTESQGSKPRDHAHPRHRLVRHLRQPHKSWQVWVVVLLMVAMTLIYVFSDDLSLFHGRRVGSPTPAVGAP